MLGDPWTAFWYYIDTTELGEHMVNASFNFTDVT